MVASFSDTSSSTSILPYTLTSLDLRRKQSLMEMQVG